MVDSCFLLFAAVVVLLTFAVFRVVDVVVVGVVDTTVGLEIDVLSMRTEFKF